MNIITRNNQEKSFIQHSIAKSFQRFEFEKIARLSNMKKEKGIPYHTLFVYLVESIFSGKSTHRDYQSKKEQLSFSDKSYRNLLNNGRVNWENFLLQFVFRVIQVIQPLTNENRRNVFIVDDSMYERPNAKNVELAAVQYDHAKGRYTKGFRFLQLGWSDGNTFLPLAFQLLSGNRCVRKPEKLDKRTNSGKRKILASQKATEVLVELLKNALSKGIKADYVLFDSWFSSPKMFQNLIELGLHSVAMLKRSKKVYYRYQGQLMDVKSIFQAEKKRRGRSRYLLSVLVQSESEEKSLPLKLVYVRNRNKRNDYLVLASTDITLSEEEIIQLYGKRWAIEVYFKMCKQYLKLAKYQGLSYDGIVAHTTIVAISYTLLALKQREEIDNRSIGDLFYLMVDELSDLSFVVAFKQLIELFKKISADELVLDDETLNNIISEFLSQLPKNYQRVFW